MGVTIKFWKRAWWVFVNIAGRRKAKHVGDRISAVRVAQALREKLARGDWDLDVASKGQTLKVYARAWLKTITGSLKASTTRFYSANLEQHVLPASAPT